jgi:hypothetical protein
MFAAMLFSFILNAWAGPPFVTDDPEPLERGHWELYFASQYNRSNEGTTGTVPQFDINYGMLTDWHLNVVVPLAYASLPENSMQYGLGDTELAVKHRFVHETNFCPQITIYPRVVFPTGNSSQELGEGRMKVFLPVWLQKSWGPWTAFGGGGFWYNNTGAGNKNYWQTGGVIQRDISKELSIGVEIFNFSAGNENEAGGTENEASETGANLGATININEESHILFSAGRDISGPNTLFMYFAYQLTVGPA